LESLVLEGVIVAANPANSVALLRRVGAKRGEPLLLGEQYAGYVLVEVRRDSVLLEGAHGRLRLTVGVDAEKSTTLIEAEASSDEEPPAKGPTVARVTGEHAPQPDPADGWIRRSISRVEANEKLVEDMPAILNHTALVPRVQDGEVRGLVVGRMPGGTLLSEAGIQPGDVLVSINGEPLRGLEALWEVLSRLRGATEIRLLVDRGGETLRLAYELTN
jgi:type II secretion system protein C